ncbi:TetR/AcrR family transcriptional regulator [Companilactobacillus musae]|uniref:TetR/AcrR family transcriptional regulator n=1 Tax=Companilactobacillus musae TaxID=1903258 RepID=UPI000E65B4FD|nr:TetR/AcrR family transcriptional regulator [Companilactobacillus musae]
MTKERKIDRRTLYTINIIKDSFLDLINQKTYTQINVAELCRQADITRSTFYLHFDNLTDVLNNVLDDAFLFNQSTSLSTLPESQPLTIDLLRENESLLPACQRIADSSKYRQLLMDPSLSEYIIGRIIAHEKDKIVPSIQKRTGLNKNEAELLFIYSINGSFAINKRHHFIKDDAWYQELQLLNTFTSGGYNSLEVNKK